MRKLVVWILAGFMISTAHAQNSKMEDIRQLMDFTGMDKLGEQLISGFTDMYKANYGEDIPGLWDSLNVIVNEGMGDLMDSIAIIYDKLYTQEEIRAMIEIYQTPIGRKMIETMPLLTELSMQAGQNWAAANLKRIEERLASFTEAYSENDFAFEDFYYPDEKFDYDNPKKVVDHESNNSKIRGSTDYQYYIHYDSTTWEVIPNDMINPLADVTFAIKNQSAFAIVIAETSSLTIQQLKAAALYNMSIAAEEMSIESIGMREVNGTEVLCMQLACLIQGEVYNYYNYYHSGDWGVLQFIVFAPGIQYHQNMNAIEGILSGLHLE